MITDPFRRSKAIMLGLDPDELTPIDVKPQEAPRQEQVQQSPTLSPTPSIIGKAWELANKPLLNVSPEFIRDTGLLRFLPDGGVKEGLTEAGANIISGLTSPVGLGAAAIAPVFPIASAAVFGGLGAKQGIDAQMKLLQDIPKGDTKAITEDVVSGGMGLLQMLPGVGAALGKFRGGIKPTGEAPPVIPPEVLPEPPLATLVPENRRLTTGTFQSMPEFTESTLGINSGQRLLPAPGGTGTRGILSAEVQDALGGTETVRRIVPGQDTMPLLPDSPLARMRGQGGRFVKRVAPVEPEPIEVEATVYPQMETPVPYAPREFPPLGANEIPPVIQAGTNPTGAVPPIIPPPVIPPVGQPASHTTPTPGRTWLGMPEVDRVEAIGTPEATVAANAFRAFDERAKEIYGKLGNAASTALRKITRTNPSVAVKDTVLTANPNRFLEYLRQDTPDTRKVEEWFSSFKDGTAQPTLTPKQEAIKQIVQDNFRQARLEQLARPELAAKIAGHGFNPEYLPDIEKSGVREAVIQNPNSVYKQDFIQDRIAKGLASNYPEAEKLFFEHIGADKITNTKVNRASHYGPIDKPSGPGLPKSWRETNLFKILSRYNEGVARRLAYHDTIETNPAAVDAIKVLNPHESVQSILRQIHGEHAYEPKLATGVAGVFKSLALALPAGLRDVGSGLFLGLQHHGNPLQLAKTTAKALVNINKNIADAWETGRIRQNISAIEMDNSTSLFDGLRVFRDVASDLQMRNGADKLIRGLSFGQGRVLAESFHNEFVRGKLSQQGKEWFNNFAKDINWRKPALTNEEIKQMAARYVDSTQGGYSFTGLPKFAYEGSLSPLLALSRWGIEKSNNYIKYTLEPASRGNFVPLLNSTIGMVLGGTVVKQITRAVSGGKKEKTPTLDEATGGAVSSALQGEMPDLSKISPMGLFYWASSLSSASGHMGWAGDLLKSVLDRTYGKNVPQPIDNILLSTTSSILNNVEALVQGAQENGVSPGMMLGFINNSLRDLSQSYRMIWAMLNPAEVDLINKKRDLKVFKTLEGMPVPAGMTGEVVPLTSGNTKEFKETQDLRKAQELAPELIKEVYKKSQNFDDFKKGLAGLRQMSYPIVPPVEDSGAGFDAFSRYYDFIAKTQGKEAADALFRQYATQQLLNKAKSSLIPSSASSDQ